MDCSSGNIIHALDRNGSLMATGLLQLEPGPGYDYRLTPMDGLSEALTRYNKDESDLLCHFLRPGKASRLHREDFPHLVEDIAILQRILNHAVNDHEPGVNILLYGPPGTGKTELARLLAQSLSATMFEVRSDNDKGDPVHSHKRLESYRFSQQFLAADESSIILFDEVEDIFPARSFSFFGMETRSGENKGWINRMLEENRTPAIWISNKVHHIDPAFLRPFDYTLAVPTPPRSVRLKIAETALQNTPVSQPWLQTLAEQDRLSPADLAKAGKLARMLACDSPQETEDALSRMLDNTMQLYGQRLCMQSEHATDYTIDLINTTTDIPELIKGLRRSGRGNICFYGAPGTGKSALAAHIAQAIDKPLIRKRASDMIDSYVGQTEQNIANMFHQAEHEQGVLLLDEADSFLRDRREAQHSWEITQVNELLVQMEQFNGIFICSTNLMDNLDQASLRRFAIKMKFGYLTTAQAEQMLRHECEWIPSEKELQQLASLTHLTPGDFAAVKKRLDILGISPKATIIIRELREELLLKEDGASGSIGFGRRIMRE